MGQFWSLKLGLAVLVVDLFRMVGMFVLSPGVADGVWLAGTLVALVLLVFKNPLGSNSDRGLDEDESVHGMTSFQH